MVTYSTIVNGKCQNLNIIIANELSTSIIKQRRLKLILSEACAYTTGNEEERKKAFDLARSCLQTLLESKDLEPDDSIFANLFLVITRHLGKGEARDRFSAAVFKEACKVNTYLL